MYYHTSSELGVEASRRLQSQDDRIRNGNSTLDNCGNMSLHDSLKEMPLVEKRVMSFINELYTKFTEKTETDSLISIPFISKSLNIPEELIMSILQKNGLELTTVEEENEY